MGIPLLGGESASLKAFAVLTGLKQNSIVLAFFLLADADFFYTCIAAYFNTLNLTVPLVDEIRVSTLGES